MSALEGTERDLGTIAKRDKALAEGSLAMSALQLAREIDREGNSATSKSMCGRELRDTMDRLRELAPEEEVSDQLDDIARQRAKRRAG